MTEALSSITTAETMLFVPGNAPDRFDKAAAATPDAIVLDLEDAVAAGAKDIARAALRTDFTELPIVIRINGAGTPWFEEDLARVRTLRPSAVMIPKAEQPEALERLDRALGRGIALIALIETALGEHSAVDIAGVPGVERLAFGSIDYAVDLGCAHTEAALQTARHALVLASRVAGCAPPLDGVTAQFRDGDRTFQEATHGRSLGYGGKLCVHPIQIEQVRRAYAPTQDEIAWARNVIASGDGTSALDGAMVDAPVKLRAAAILARS